MHTSPHAHLTASTPHHMHTSLLAHLTTCIHMGAFPLTFLHIITEVNCVRSVYIRKYVLTVNFFVYCVNVTPTLSLSLPSTLPLPPSPSPSLPLFLKEHLYASLPRITQIQLGRNSFTTFPISHPEDLASIQNLALDHNSIGKVPLHIFTQAPNLTVVNLRDNQITSLPLDFNTWSTLTELDLGTNQIQTLPREYSQTSLQHHPW